jgi:transposase InsO family protein
MKNSNSKGLAQANPAGSTPSPLKLHTPPPKEFRARLPASTPTVPAGTAISVFSALPESPDWNSVKEGDTVLIEPWEDLTRHTGLCALPACQLVTANKGVRGVFFLVANPSKLDAKHPGRKAPRVATISKLRPSQIDKSDDYIMQPVYERWFAEQAGLTHTDLESFQELYGRGRVASDTDISKGNWWINPPWKLIPKAMDKIREDRPEKFFIFGPSAKHTPWITEARRWGLQELKPPRTLGTEGYFLIRQFDNSLKTVPFPQHWDLVGFYGTRNHIPNTVTELTASLHGDFGEHTKVTIDEANLTPMQIAQAKGLIQEFQDVFKTDDYPVVPDFEMEIDTGDETPTYERPHRYSPADVAAEEAALKQMLALNVIEPGYGAWSSRRLQVRKPDGTWRQCVDYRRLNLKTKRDLYPLPRIADILDTLHNANFISTSDMWKGYWQVSIKESDRPKTGFLTRQGLYQFRVMPFGLKNAPAIYQRLMDTTLSGLLWVTCLCYIDDLISFGPDFDTALLNLREVLHRLRSRNMRLRADKCFWFFREVKLLGHIVTAHSQKPDPEKLAAITNMIPPRNKDEVASFLGLVGWYQRFIPKFATIASPLFDLKRNNVTFVWTSKEQQAWQTLKDALTSSNVMLAQPDPSKRYVLETDASYHAIGGVLQQQDDHGEWRPILYLSRRLSKAEQNYAPTEIECLAVLFCVEKCRCYVLGNQFSILTDHKSLQWLLTTKTHQGRLARWALRLQEFDYTITHRAGPLQVVADALSRLPTNQPEPDTFPEDETGPAFVHISLSTHNSQHICALHSCAKEIPVNPKGYKYCSFGCRQTASLLKAKQALYTALSTVNPCSPPPTLAQLKLPSTDDIKQAQHDAPELKIWFTFVTLKKPPPPGHPQKQLFHKYVNNITLDANDILVFRLNADATPVTVVPNTLRPLFLHFFHDMPTSGGHFGRQKTLEHMQRHCWWPTMPADVAKYVAACICRRTQTKNTPTHTTPLLPIQSQHPNDIVAGDVAGPFPTCDGARYILVLTCLFSRYTRLFAINSTSAEDAAIAFYHGWVLLFGPPAKFLSDQGPQFTAELLRHFCRLLGVQKVFTTPYHPQGDGAAERRFRTLNNSINACHQANLPWTKILDCIAYAYNNSYNRMIDAIPFQVFLGRLPKKLSDIERDNGEQSEEILNARAYGHMAYTRLLQETKTTHDAIVKAQQTMARDHDKRAETATFRLFDLVWLFTPRLQTQSTDGATSEPEPSRKLQNYWGSSPWVIMALHPPNNATIQNIWGEQQRVHFNRLIPYVSPLPGAVTTHNGHPLLIHHIVSTRKYGRTTSFKVRWFPFNIKPDSNVSEADVPTRLLLEYEQRMHQTDPDNTACEICTRTDNAADMLLCDGCDKGFHNPCLNRTPGDIPTDAWFCPTCLPFAMHTSQSATLHTTNLSSKGGEM